MDFAKLNRINQIDILRNANTTGEILIRNTAIEKYFIYIIIHLFQPIKNKLSNWVLEIFG
jgi:hypothetical protein